MQRIYLTINNFLKVNKQLKCTKITDNCKQTAENLFIFSEHHFRGNIQYFYVRVRRVVRKYVPHPHHVPPKNVPKNQRNSSKNGNM